MSESRALSSFCSSSVSGCPFSSRSVFRSSSLRCRSLRLIVELELREDRHAELALDQVERVLQRLLFLEHRAAALQQLQLHLADLKERHEPAALVFLEERQHVGEGLDVGGFVTQLGDFVK